MTTNLNDLVELMRSQYELPKIASVVAEMLSSGYSSNEIADRIEFFCETHEISENYEDGLDDIIAAMEGWCDKDYFLHPSHYRRSCAKDYSHSL
ncbi:hypothetical protein QPB19_000136 [Vibrio cholerae]|uniref:hypothetical protein n=1 Tax=Vibrio cholerae TaxID=666 RepID=UPI00296BCD12|nr:hypothetical protein [Vibrio cholerae]ELU3953801.1 hypothetical protein [Vibrio cholerae]